VPLAGLELLDTEIMTEVARPGDPAYEYSRATVIQGAPIVVQLGLLTEEEAMLMVSFWDHPGTAITTGTIVSTWGRRP
jgi:hypothetical protein